MTANDKTGVGSGRDDWRTPPELFARLDRMFQFDFDAFASHENHLLPHYATAHGVYAPPEENDDCLGHDGLSLPWFGRVFMNPPYSRGFLARATEKAALDRNVAQIIVALLPDARDTAWWRKWVRPYATDYPIGRVRFLRPDGTPGDSPPGGSVVVVYLPDWLNGGEK